MSSGLLVLIPIAAGVIAGAIVVGGDFLCWYKSTVSHKKKKKKFSKEKYQKDLLLLASIKGDFKKPKIKFETKEFYL